MSSPARMAAAPGDRRAHARSGSPTTCSRPTGRARSWRCRGTTSATTSSPARSTCRSSRWCPAADLEEEAFIGRRRQRRTPTSSTGCRPPDAEATHDRVAREHGKGGASDQLQAARLALQPPALLGRAVPGHPPGGRQHRGSCRKRTAAAAAGTRRLQALGRVRAAARARERLDRDDGSRDRRARAAGHQHHAPVGGQLLVLPALLRSAQRSGPWSRRSRALLDARGPLRRRRRARGAPPALRALLAQGLSTTSVSCTP